MPSVVSGTVCLVLSLPKLQSASFLCFTLDPVSSLQLRGNFNRLLRCTSTVAPDRTLCIFPQLQSLVRDHEHSSTCRHTSSDIDLGCMRDACASCSGISSRGSTVAKYGYLSSVSPNQHKRPHVVSEFMNKHRLFADRRSLGARTAE